MLRHSSATSAAEPSKDTFRSTCARTIMWKLMAVAIVELHSRRNRSWLCTIAFIRANVPTDARYLILIHFYKKRPFNNPSGHSIQVCWQAFAHSSVLKLHIRKHTGEKPFRCMMCTEVETAFSQLPHLKTHMRAIHGMDKAYKCMPCSEFFKTKHELVEHKLKCAQSLKQNRQTEPSQSDPAASEDNTSMSLSKLRLLIAVLLKEISSQDRLKKLGFDKRLIDNVLIAALQMAEQPVCGDNKLSEIERLRINVNQFLKWTIPEDYMEKLELQHRTPEEVLENLASHFRPKEAIKSNNNIKKRE